MEHSPCASRNLAAGPLFRELVAQFCESPQAETCEVSLQQTDAAEQAKFCVDRALLERLLENLLGNSIRHNSAPVEIEVQTDVAGNRFCLTVADNGTGYPPAGSGRTARHAAERADPGTFWDFMWWSRSPPRMAAGWRSGRMCQTVQRQRCGCPALKKRPLLLLVRMW